MTGESAARAHDRARRLIATDRVEGVPEADRVWLELHLEGCPACAQEAAALASAVQQLRMTPVVAAPELVRRTRLAVRRRAVERSADRSQSVPLWVAVTLSGLWMLVTAPLAWRSCAWIGRAAGLPDVVWQAGFLTWWFLPATVLAAIMAWRHAGGDARSPFDTAQMEWRSR